MNIFLKRTEEFKRTVIELKNLPKSYEKYFTDGADQRTWFNDLLKIKEEKKIKNFIKEIEDILKEFNIKILDDNERIRDFLKEVKIIQRLPKEKEIYFIDNLDMRTWYNSYIHKNNDFEEIVHQNLKEYQELDIAEFWPSSKKEIIEILKQIKKIPNHGEVNLNNGIDFRTIYDKLEKYDPTFIEQVRISLSDYNNIKLNKEKEEIFKETIKSLGYIPILQEKRFPDQIDMYTWYKIISKKNNKLKLEVEEIISNKNLNKYINLKKDALFYNDLFYYIKKIVGIEIEYNKETELRIIERFKTKESTNILNISDFEIEFFEFIRRVSQKIGNDFKSITDITNYPIMVEKEIKKYEQELINKKTRKLNNI